MTSVLLHPLAMRDEGAEWVVGRVESGVFVALPRVGVQVIENLQSGRTVPETAEILSAETGEPVDVAGFVGRLAKLGFVAELDGVAVAGRPLPRSTFASVLPRHVRWLLNPLVGVAAFAIVVLGLVAALLGRAPVPADAVWSPRGSLVVLGQIVMTWSVIFLHELAHLFTARAAGMPGRMTFGTRLQFLCAQTNVSGVWVAPRRTRIAVYLSGMALNAVLLGIGLLLFQLPGNGGWHDFAAVLSVTQVVLLAGQFMFFMRTDVYFVVQDLARCRNLYGDATAYVRYLGRFGRSADPTAALPPRERRAVRWYAAFLVPGTVICLGVFAAVTLPITLTLLTRSIGSVTDSALAGVDSALVIVALVTAQIIWFRAWWRKHGPRVRALLRRRSASRRTRA